MLVRILWRPEFVGFNRPHALRNSFLQWRHRGINGVGQLGDGTTTTRATPVQITEPDSSGQAWVELSLHTETSCAVRSAGDLFCWVSGGATMETCGDVHSNTYSTASKASHVPTTISSCAPHNKNCRGKSQELLPTNQLQSTRLLTSLVLV